MRVPSLRGWWCVITASARNKVHWGRVQGRALSVAQEAGKGLLRKWCLSSVFKMYKLTTRGSHQKGQQGQDLACEQAWRTEQTRVWLTTTEHRERNAERGSEDHAEFVSLAHMKFGLHSVSTEELLMDWKCGRVTKTYLCFIEIFYDLCGKMKPASLMSVKLHHTQFSMLVVHQKEAWS